MTALFELEEITAEAWEPVWLPQVPEECRVRRADGPDDFVEGFDYKAWQKANPYVCRDCGVQCGYNQGGSRGPAQAFMLCDDCAEIDGCRVVDHVIVLEPGMTRNQYPAIAHCTGCGWWLDSHMWTGAEHVLMTDADIEAAAAKHRGQRHSSRWGRGGHEISEHDGLVAARERRRANYGKKVKR